MNMQPPGSKRGGSLYKDVLFNLLYPKYNKKINIR